MIDDEYCIVEEIAPEMSDAAIETVIEAAIANDASAVYE